MALPAHITVTDNLVSAFGLAQAMIERGIREAKDSGNAHDLQSFEERRVQVAAAWDAFQSAGRAAKSGRIRKRLERGGPTVQEPNRPYCKPDQSCCDFTCGN